MSEKHDNTEWVDVTDQMLEGNTIKGEDALKYLAGNAVVDVAAKRSQDQRMKKAGQEIADAVKKVRK